MRILCLGIQPRLLSAAATAAKSLQSCPTLCDPIDGSPPGSPVPGILQARTLEGVAISFSNAWQWKSESEVVQSCLTLSDPMDCSLPGSSIHWIFQAKVLEWGVIAFSESNVYKIFIIEDKKKKKKRTYTVSIRIIFKNVYRLYFENDRSILINANTFPLTLMDLWVNATKHNYNSGKLQKYQFRWSVI